MTDWPKGVAKPAVRALNAAGYTTLQQLAQVDLATLENLHGIGQKALAAIETALKESRKLVE
ncbi:MAG: DNA-directed RNA polymerase subunit alpha C-terminal domain-containing protein [Lysinibacillus sp.]